VDPDAPPPAAAEQCRRVDVVIAVDGSGSMSEELRAMRDTIFPAFASRLGSIGGGLDDFRVATLDACPTPAAYHTRGKGGECNFHGGHPWIESASPNLQAEFACVGDVDTTSNTCTGDDDDERPASTAAASLELPFLTTENAGFARADALLVVVAITDEDEQPIPDMTAQGVHDRLVATKGDVRRMVFLGIGGGSSCNGAYGSAQEATKLKAITDRFTAEQRGVWWDLCAGHLEDGLEQAIAIIESACAELPTID
jgi:hypothetical protein